MKLSEALPAIKTGDCFLFRGTSLFAHLVKWKTSSVYSHAGIAWRVPINGTFRVCVIEALEPFGVRVYPLDKYVEDGEQIDWYSLRDGTVNGDEAAKFALKQWGKPYALKQLWWSFSRVAWLIRLLLRRRPTNVDPNRWFCSELVAAALLHAGFKPDAADVIDPDETVPGQVAQFTCLRRRGLLEPD